MKKQHICWILSLFLLEVSTLKAQLRSEKRPSITKEDVKSDYQIALDILKKQHPNPYKFVDSIQMKRGSDSLQQLISRAPDVYAAMQYSPVQLFHDVHTNLQWSDDLTKEIYQSIRFFPFPVVLERGHMLVNTKSGPIPYGSEVYSIDGKSIAQIEESLRSSSYSDGFISTGTDRIYSNFQLTWSLRNADKINYQIVYSLPHSTKKQQINLRTISAAEGFHSSRLAIQPVNQLQRAYWIIGDYDETSKTGLLTVNTFNLQEPFAYKEFSAFFREVKRRGYQHVVIDIRNNGGGNPAISALLYSFLALKPFDNVYNYRTKTISLSYPQYAITEGNRAMSEDDINNNQNFLHQRFDQDIATGFYIGNARLREGQVANFPPDKDAFHGQVYVLTGGGTVSAATYFASLVQKNNRGIIVGKETGSGEQSTTAAWFLNYLLPKTKATLTVPMSELYFFNAQTDKGRGVIPDKEVPFEKYMSYFLAGQDPEWSYVLTMIK